MSLDHLNNITDNSLSEIHPQEERNQFYDYQIHNMYDKDKHVNPHDIAGQQGLVMTQAVELEKKKVPILFLTISIYRSNTEWPTNSTSGSTPN